MNLRIVPFTMEDIDILLSWNEDKGADFLRQWAGGGYAYPLTYEQVMEKINESQRPQGECQLFKIMREETVLGLRMARTARMIGTVELNTARMPRQSAMVCRFLMDPAYQGRGYGACALMLLTQMAFYEFGYKMLRLKVFAFNKPAIRCYEKAGFMPCGYLEWSNGWQVMEMEIKKKW